MTRKTLHVGLVEACNFCLVTAACRLEDGCVEVGLRVSAVVISEGDEVSLTAERVSCDICGPLPTNSLSGKRYFITFTDDYSRYTKTYLLKGKDEAYEKIKDYVISAHTEFGKNIQTIRTDNGREYVNRQVEDFLNQSGIKHQLTVPYSPAQNGVAERKNRSLMEMTRCMLFDSGLPQSLWAEAVTTANYLHNRIPSKATDKTPFELWTNRKPSLKHLKRFGCKAFAYIPKIKRNKLDSKVIEGIFLGYDDRSKGYRILHDTDNITISRSVKFIEKENGFHLASTKTTSPQVLSTDLTFSNHIGNAEESQEPGTQSENLEDSETEDYIQPGTSTGTQVVTQRRSTRQTKGIPPIRNDYMLYKTEAQDIPTPTSYSEVLQLPKIEREKWLQAMNEELNSLEKNNVWELTPLPKDKKIIGCEWTYKQKLNSKGEIERYKARLVAKGFNQKFGRDYEETFAPIVKHSTIRAFLAASVYKGMQVIHLDVKTAFLHGDLDKELYMELPEGLHTKQTNKSIVDPCLFTKNEENHSIYLILYVDDMLLASDFEIIIQNTVKTLEKEFEIKNLGDPTQFIGIEISRNREGELLLSQKNKIQELVERYNLQEAKPTFTPMESGYPGISDEKLLPNNVQYQQLIGSLLYLSVVSRPDIAAPVCILSSRNQNPRNCDWNAAKRIVRFLKTTKELELRISNQKPPTLEAYSDATWASDNTDRKSLSGNLFLLGSNPISWMTGKQGCVSLSSTEAELISAAEASQELLWLLDLLKDLELEQKAPIYFHQDNQSCLKICSSEKVSSRTKHIATKIHHLKDLQKKTVIKMIYCPTGDMKADILTKPLPRPTFEKLRYNLVILTNVAAIDSADSELMEDLIRRIVREEVHRALNPESTTPEPSSLKEIIREEIEKNVAAISKPIQRPPPRQSYPNQTRTFNQVPRRQYSTQTPIYDQRPPQQGTDEWRTHDNIPICFNCGRPGHVKRYCRERREWKQRPEGYAPSTQEPQMGNHQPIRSLMFLRQSPLSHNKGKLWVVNSSTTAQIVPKGMCLGKIQRVEENNLTAISECSEFNKEVKNAYHASHADKSDFNFLQNLISDDLSEEQQSQILSILKRYDKIFDKNNEPVKQTSVTKHKIETGNHQPIKHRPYRVSPTERQTIQTEVDKMLDAGIIRHSESRWSSQIYRNFAEKAAPLHEVLKKDNKFTWNSDQQDAFDSLKKSLMSEPVLTYFEEQLPTELHTDASGYEIGAVLVQINDGKKRPVDYASITLSKAEKNYSTTERECLAAIWAINKIRPYLFG
ncbi:hypothetical protein LAZ67_19001352, partial [Cordylochernes scorpioides]